MPEYRIAPEHSSKHHVAAVCSGRHRLHLGARLLLEAPPRLGLAGARLAADAGFRAGRPIYVDRRPGRIDAGLAAWDIRHALAKAARHSCHDRSEEHTSEPQ